MRRMTAAMAALSASLVLAAQAPSRGACAGGGSGSERPPAREEQRGDRARDAGAERPQRTGAGRDRARDAETVRPQRTGSERRSDARGEAAERASIATHASRLINERRYDEAIRMLVLAGERFPEDDRFVELLSTAYLRSGRPLDAIRILETRLGKAPNRFAFVRDLGIAFLEAGQRERAVSTWHSILGEGEGRGPYYVEVAQLEWSAGMYERAFETLREGLRTPAAAARCRAEIVRLERVRGNYRAAFRAGLGGLVETPAPSIPAAGPVIASFREAGRPPELVRAVDSLAAAVGDGNAHLLRMLHAVLLLETGDEAGIADFLAAVRRGAFDARDLSHFIDYLLSQPGPDDDGAFERILARVVDAYVERHGESQSAAKVMLEAARRAARRADQGESDRREAVERCLALCDAASAHPAGGPIARQAALVKARVLLEHRLDPEAALAALEGLVRPGAQIDVETERIRLEAVLAAGRWEQARRRFGELAEAPDPVLAAMGRYGLGMADFYRGAFEEAVEGLAAMAEAAPWSEWANDALAVAVLIRQALREGHGPAGLLAAGMAAARAGRTVEALDSLDALAAAHPASVLAPRGIYESALLLARAGREDEARERLERIAERYPLDAHAPRALERLALLLERDEPAAAAGWYLLLLERYPHDPWIARARERYQRLRVLLEGGGRGKDGA